MSNEQMLLEAFNEAAYEAVSAFDASDKSRLRNAMTLLNNVRANYFVYLEKQETKRHG